MGFANVPTLETFGRIVMETFGRIVEFLSQRYIFASVRIGNFDDARRSNDEANYEAKSIERLSAKLGGAKEIYLLHRTTRRSSRGVAQIDRYILRRVIGELTVHVRDKNASV